jgi:hypothetical protein
MGINNPILSVNNRIRPKYLICLVNIAQIYIAWHIKEFYLWMITMGRIFYAN